MVEMQRAMLQGLEGGLTRGVHHHDLTVHDRLRGFQSRAGRGDGRVHPSESFRVAGLNADLIRVLDEEALYPSSFNSYSQATPCLQGVPCGLRVLRSARQNAGGTLTRIQDHRAR